MASNNDFIQKFYFPQASARGAIVKLGNSFVESINGHNYPGSINQLLGESLAAATLLSTHLKFSSRFTFQAQGEGAVSLLFAEAVLTQPQPGQSSHEQQHSHTVRAFARIKDRDFLFEQNYSLPQVLGESTLAMTVEPFIANPTTNNRTTPTSQDRYQSMIEVSHPSLAENLRQYFRQSEQLPTQLKLAVNDTLATGILLQQMPPNGGENRTIDSDNDVLWQELEILASTLTEDEMLSLPAPEVLHRLFHEHDYQLYAPEPVTFACHCSQQRSANALKTLNNNDLQEILDQDGEIVIDCEFCSAKYRFGQPAIDAIWANAHSTKQ